MKDLTHYFVSPPKLCEDTATRMNNQNPTSGTVASEDWTTESKSDTEVGKKTPRKKRSRVKIKISVNGSRTRRCDIINNADDVVDKTPSPFTNNSKIRGASRKSVSDTECTFSCDKNENSDDDSPRGETANAFDVMMTRGRSPRYRTSPHEAEAVLDKSKDYRNTLDERKQRLVAPLDRKGYPKRKLTDLEEAELIEKSLKKPAKLFRCDDDDKEEDGARRKKENGKGELKGQVMPSTQTPKTKAKWTMKVKLQSHSDDDEMARANENLSDDDFIFTPKSKVKFGKIKSQERRGDVEIEAVERRFEKNKKDVTLDGPASKSSFVASGVRGSKDLRYKKHKAKKKRIDFNKDAKQSPVKETLSNAEETDGEIITVKWSDGVIVDENRVETYDSGGAVATKKLAPLFVKKSKTNSTVTEARRSFLQSGIPERIKKVAVEQKNCCNDIGYSSMPFPGVSHVSQLQSEVDIEESNAGSRCTLYKRKLELSPVTMSLDSGEFRSINNFREAEEELLDKFDLEKFVRVDKTDLENVIQEIESRCSNARTMWTNITMPSNHTPKKCQKKRNKKLKLQKKDNVPEPEDGHLDSPNPTWTCKYKPTNSAEVVGNDAAIMKLRNWLSGWRLPASNVNYSSGDEFDSSDGSSSSCYENNQVAVLLGPHGSGKTASVYAIAEELGYRVLEVNASSRRTGKKLLTDFQEATKSHRVKRGQRTLSPAKIKSLEEKKVPQNSLILIEDVDIIFDEDEGFVSATCQLAANTRRPIVMTCRQPCPHLNKMASRQQLIRFQAVTGNAVSALLELISLAESGYRLPKSCLDILLRNGDLRQSLLQLQCILLSGPPNTRQLFPNARENLWRDTRYLLYKPAVKRSKKYGKVNADKKSVAEEDAKVVNELATKLDCVLLISSLTDVENPTPPPWNRKLNPSLSLVQDFHPYSNSDDLSREIADWLRRVTLRYDRSINPTNFDAESHLSITRNVKLGIDFALSQAVSSTLEHRSKSTDYLPVIRTICRAEEERAKVNTKRSKRFHNYLHGLNVASTSSNVLAAASSVFQEKLS